MVRASGSSRASSPTASLKPAPLRIPSRKAVVVSRDSDADLPVTGLVDGAKEASTSRVPLKVLAQHRRQDMTRILSRRRTTDPKLEPILSKFEVVDAANSTDPTALSRCSGSPPNRPSVIQQAARPHHSLHPDEDPQAPSPYYKPPTLSHRIIEESTILVSSYFKCYCSTINRSLVGGKDAEVDGQQTSTSSSSQPVSSSTASQTSRPPG
jgi:hypothetical protein